MAILIDAYLTPFFPEHESLFEDAAVVMIDVLRASTTTAFALQSGAKEIIPADSLEKAVKLYNSLSKEVRFLGGERNGLKPSGFDAGNSPFEYTPENVKGKSVILTTSNGTRIFLKGKQAAMRLVGSFVNYNAILEHIYNLYLNQRNNPKILFLCAGNDGKLSYEDMLCAGAFISALNKKYPDCIITDTAVASMNLYDLHSSNLSEYLKARDHAQKLIKLGFESDLEYCLTIDECPIVPIISNASIKKYDADSK